MNSNASVVAFLLMYWTCWAAGAITFKRSWLPVILCYPLGFAILGIVLNKFSPWSGLTCIVLIHCWLVIQMLRDARATHKTKE